MGVVMCLPLLSVPILSSVPTHVATSDEDASLFKAG